MDKLYDISNVFLNMRKSLKPLSRGEHEIRSTGSLAEVTVEGTQNFASDAIYHITVE